jgi:hypothetical protein
VIFAKRAEAADAEHIKSRFTFSMLAGRENRKKRTLFRDPIGLEIFEKIVSRLRADGFRATEAKPTKASVATFKIKFPELDVTASLLASWRGHRIECRLYIGCITPVWRHVPQTIVSERWVQGCAAIEKILRADLSVEALSLLTKEEERSLRLP